MMFKTSICFLVILNISINLIRGIASDSLSKHRKSDSNLEFKDYDKPYFVPLCYREGNDCCESFRENCLDHKDCNHNEICCLANCTIQCFDVSLLGRIPDKVLNEVNDTVELELLDADPDFIRYPTNARSDIPSNRSDCFPRNEKTCCAVYLKKCHDSNDCEDEEVCCNQNCGTACYPKDKLGEKLFPDGLTQEELEDRIIGDYEEEDAGEESPVMITAKETDDGTLTIVVKNYKP